MQANCPKTPKPPPWGGIGLSLEALRNPFACFLEPGMYLAVQRIIRKLRVPKDLGNLKGDPSKRAP